VLGARNQRSWLRPGQLVARGEKLLVLDLATSSNHLDGDGMVHGQTRWLPMLPVIMLVISAPRRKGWRLTALTLCIHRMPALLLQTSRSKARVVARSGAKTQLSLTHPCFASPVLLGTARDTAGLQSEVHR